MKYLFLIIITSAILLGCKKNNTNPDDLITINAYYKIRAGDTTFSFYIPSGFTPNGDGINEYWEPKSNRLDSSDYHISIFDKSGKEVFESDAPKPFYGKYKNGKTISLQTLCYNIDAKNKDGEKFNFYGKFILYK